MLPAGTARRIRYGLLAVFAALAACAVGLATRHASLGELTSAIQRGAVSEVTVHGGLPAGASGFNRVTIEWRDGAVGRLTTVVEQSADASLGTQDAVGAERVVGDVKPRLVAADPTGSLRVTPAAERLPSGPEVAGWNLPDWMGPAMILLWFATVLLMYFGPEPWWATRWGWVWLMFGQTALVGVPLYLLASGPPPGVEAPERPGWRLTRQPQVFVSSPVLFLCRPAGSEAEPRPRSRRRPTS